MFRLTFTGQCFLASRRLGIDSSSIKGVLVFFMFCTIMVSIHSLYFVLVLAVNPCDATGKSFDVKLLDGETCLILPPSLRLLVVCL